MSDIAFPRRPRGRPPKNDERYKLDLAAFCASILEINSRLDFKVSSRGWCYILEEHGLGKGDFNAAQTLINDCRKTGLLPIDICAEDESRVPTFWVGGQRSHRDVEEFIDGQIQQIEEAHESYSPMSVWDYQDCYIEIMVEKIDLKSLFEPVCADYSIPIANARGWSDINSRARLMARFKGWEDKGKQCVLLYCGDHDPAGLNISDSLIALFEEMQGAIGWNPSHLIIDRFGLNKDFIDTNGLTWIEGLETGSGRNLADNNHEDHNKPYVQTYLKRFGARKVEANALVVRPEQGRQLCRNAFLRYINQDGIETYQADIEEAREEAQQALRQRMAP